MSAKKPDVIRLDIDEYHPFHSERDDGFGVEVDFIDADTLARWRKVMADFAVVQAEMGAAYSDAERVARARRQIAELEADAQRLEEQAKWLRYEIDHPPEDPRSWPSPGDFPCMGRPYGSSQDANRARVVVYDKVSARGAQFTFDVAPYTCVDGHWHLGRSTPA